MTVLTDSDRIRHAGERIDHVYAGRERVWPSYAQAVLEDEPVAYWRLGDSGTTAADETGTQDGAYSGAHIRGEPSLLPNGEGAATTFAGGRVTIPFVPEFAFGGPRPLTIEAWLQSAATTFQSVIQTPTRSSLFLGIQWGTSIWLRANGVGNAPVATWPDVTPQHVVIIWAYDSFFRPGPNWAAGIFINGKYDKFVGWAQPDVGVNDEALTIGHGLGPFNGQLQEIAVYDYAFAHAQVRRHYRAAGRETMSVGPHRAVRVRTATGWHDVALKGEQGDPAPVYEQTTPPADDTLGAIWINPNEAPPIGVGPVGPIGPPGADGVWVSLTQTAFDALQTAGQVDPATLYIIVS